MVGLFIMRTCGVNKIICTAHILFYIDSTAKIEKWFPSLVRIASLATMILMPLDNLKTGIAFGNINCFTFRTFRLIPGQELGYSLDYLIICFHIMMSSDVKIDNMRCFDEIFISDWDDALRWYAEIICWDDMLRWYA